MSPAPRFVPLARLLHWLMALLLLAQLLVGVAMMASLTLRPPLIALHRPLGLALLVLVLLRLWVRRRHPPPTLPADLPRWQAAAARASHLLLYALMLALPLLGWALTSAAGNVVPLPGAVQLPAIAPHDPLLYAWLRDAHGLLAWVLLASVLGHLAAALHHAWVRRDGVFEAMAGGRPLPSPGAD
ncbi:cytochrome b/b6 domain-containing protein [Thermomonas sp.]|jgi:cytochrome b561|uniref:cytochrome b n=1 Tax=Thermomonas sp. TaxID=1971895 RepID=UPI00257CE00C|nr:cytochrome b/b6 domain-containing protein [Thermomonas sp.]